MCKKSLKVIANPRESYNSFKGSSAISLKPSKIITSAHGRRGQLFAAVQRGGEQGQNLLHIAHDAVVAVLEDRRVTVLIDGHDGGGVLDALKVLGCAGDAAGDVQIAGELLTGHTHIAVQRQIFESLRHRAGRTDGRAGGLGQRLYQFHVLFLPDALARGDHPLRLRDGRIHRDAHGEVVTILLQRRHKVGHLLGSIPLPEDGLFANAGDGRGFLGRRTALAAGALAQPADEMGVKSLEAQGVEILTCGTCLDYYGLKDKLAVGSVTNMYSIVETMANAEKILRP